MNRASRRPRFAPLSFFAAGAALSIVPSAFAETPASVTSPSNAPMLPAKTRSLSLRKVGQVQSAAPMQTIAQATPQTSAHIAAQTPAQTPVQTPAQTPAAQPPQPPQTLPQIVTPTTPPSGQPNGPGSVNDVPQPSAPTPPTPFPKAVPSTDKSGVTPDTIKPTTVFNDNNAVPPGQPLPTDPNTIHTLDDALQIAFTRNPNVLIAQERAMRTVRSVDQILALKKPQVSATGTYARLLNGNSNAVTTGGLSPAQITNPFAVGLTSTPPGSTPISLSGSSATGGSAGATTSGTVGQTGATNTSTTTTAAATRAVLPGSASESTSESGDTRQTTGGGTSGGTSGGTGTTTPGGGTGGNTSGGNSTTTSFGRSTNLNVATARVSVSQLIDLTGIVRAAERVGQLEEALTRLELARTRQETALQVKNGYYSVLRAQAFVGVNEAAVAQSAELLRVTTAQKDAGVASQFDVLRAQTQLDNNRQALISSRNQVAIAKNSFANTLGIDPSTPVAPEIPVVPPPPVLDEPALIQTAINQRPEYLQSDINIIKAQQNIKLAHRNIEPYMNVSAGGSYDSTTAGLDHRTGGSLGVSLTVPLYDGGATRASVEAARTDERGALIQKDQFVRGIKAEVQQSVIAVGDARDRSVAVAATVTQAQEALRLANVRFRAGVGTQLDVNDAQVALTQAQTNQVNAQYDYLGALARLSRAVGNPE